MWICRYAWKSYIPVRILILKAYIAIEHIFGQELPFRDCQKINLSSHSGILQSLSSPNMPGALLICTSISISALLELNSLIKNQFHQFQVETTATVWTQYWKWKTGFNFPRSLEPSYFHGTCRRYFHHENTVMKNVTFDKTEMFFYNLLNELKQLVSLHYTFSNH